MSAAPDLRPPDAARAPATASDLRGALATYALAAGSAILFSSKGVFVKLGYRYGVDPLTLLVLRMSFSFPAFLAMAWAGGGRPIAAADWWRLAGLGFVGYYLSSLVNFTGLQFISVGLERIILFSYPTLILVFSAIFLKKTAARPVWIAAAVAWVGIALSFGGEIRAAPSLGHAFLGAGLVLLSAISYAFFLMGGEPLVGRVGALRFTGIAVGFSCLFMALHFAATKPLASLFQLAPQVYGCGLILAVFGTVLPSLLMGLGLQRAGASRFAIIATVGPVATIFLAWAVLGEQPGMARAIGFALALGGGTVASLQKR